MSSLDELRSTIKSLDEDIVDLVNERVQTAKKIGEIKQEKQRPIKNYHVEQQVINRFKDHAESAGLLERTGEELAKILITEAVRGQEEDRRQANRKHDGDTYLIVGGEGNMGTWLSQFLQEGGAEVKTVDKSPEADYTSIPSLQGFDCVIISTPVHITPTVISELRKRGTNTVIADITSVKQPVAGELEQAAEAGLPVTSFHPMFDHTTTTLDGKNVVIASLNDEEADSRIQSLFDETAASVTTIPFDEHDDHIRHTLGLPHVISLVFGSVLSSTGMDKEDLLRLGGTTFTEQTRATEQVFQENPDVYHAIQYYTEDNNAFNQIRETLEAVEEASNSDTPYKMRTLMKKGQSFFEE